MIEKNLRKIFIINSLIFFSIFLLDRISKIYVIYLDKKFFGSEIYYSAYLNIYLVWNKGIAFGLFSFIKNNLYNYLSVFILIVLFVIFKMLLKSSGLKKYALIMILGGGLGNLYDRILYKKVPDFIDFHIGDFHWFVFNLADVFITLGVFFMILFEIIGNNKNKKYE
mgnify:CR=1 FL=1